MTPPVPKSPFRVLLVEDNEHDRVAFRRALGKGTATAGKSAGSFAIEEYARGEDALARLSSNPARADVVTVDYNLPGITGFELFAELRDRIGESRLPPFLMLTGAGTEELAVRAIKIGIYDYLVKDPDNRYLRLLSTVLISVYRRHQQHLAYREAQRQLAAAHRELENQVAQRTRDLAHTVKSLKQEVQVRMKTERKLRESRKRLRKLSVQAIEAQENERKAIARELHDGIGGNLAAIKMSLETRIARMGEPPSDDGVSFETIVGYLKDTIGDLRRISARLRPKDLDSLGLIGAIRSSIRRKEEQCPGLRGSMQCDAGEEEVPGSLKVEIYRIVQEALTNTAKHAEAANVHVHLRKRDETLLLTIEDDGRGFEPEAIDPRKPEKGGFGLKSMRDRSELNAGSLSVESAPGQGTRVRLEFPLQEIGGA